jgi:hypothetical protein
MQNTAAQCSPMANSVTWLCQLDQLHGAQNCHSPSPERHLFSKSLHGVCGKNGQEGDYFFKR